jgi:Ca2+-binding RTX toxin-like protein
LVGNHTTNESENQMTSLTTNSWSRLAFLAAAVIAFAVTALAVAAHSSAHKRTHDKGAHSNRVEGVRAELRRGTLNVKGSDGGQQVAVRLRAGDPSQIQVDAGDDGSADFTFARADVHAINVKMGDGNDSARIDDANGAFTDSIPTTIAGGDGNDTLAGGQVQPLAENETFIGGGGNDLVDGGKGNDTAYLGDGNDTFRWDNGEGSDVVEGQDGTDTMVFNGAAGTENVTMSANGGRLTFFRVQGNVTMDTNDVEIVDDNPIGGADSITVNDLTGTDVTQTNIDLAGAFGGNVGDGVVDNVVVNGTNGDDNIAINGNGSGADVTGLATAVSVKHADTTDTLSVNTLAGTDHVTANGVAGVLQVLVDGAAV